MLTRRSITAVLDIPDDISDALLLLYLAYLRGLERQKHEPGSGKKGHPRTDQAPVMGEREADIYQRHIEPQIAQHFRTKLAEDSRFRQIMFNYIGLILERADRESKGEAGPDDEDGEGANA